jgi:head-tail adaptor
MTAGKRDQRVTVERYGETPDGAGGTLQGWAAFCQRWVEVKPMSGRERSQASRTIA